jgi:hypothetical protein
VVVGRVLVGQPRGFGGVALAGLGVVHRAEVVGRGVDGGGRRALVAETGQGSLPLRYRSPSVVA